jgi:hypothetical protein
MPLVFRFDPVVTPVFDPVPVAVVDDDPGAELMPAEPGFAAPMPPIALAGGGALGEAPLPLLPPTPCAELAAVVTTSASAAMVGMLKLTGIWNSCVERHRENQQPSDPFRIATARQSHKIW